MDCPRGWLFTTKRQRFTANRWWLTANCRWLMANFFGSLIADCQ